MRPPLILALALAIASLPANAIAIRPSKINLSMPGEYRIPITLVESTGENVLAEIRIFTHLSQPVEEGILLDEIALLPNEHYFNPYDLNFIKKGSYLICAGYYKSRQYLRSCTQVRVGL